MPVSTTSTFHFRPGGTPAGPSIALVSAGALTESGTPAFGQPVTAGSLLVALAGNNGTGSASTTAAGWVLAAGGGTSCTLWYREDCGAAESPPVFSYPGSDIWVQLLEFSGAGSPGAFLAAAAGSFAGATWNLALAGPDIQPYDLVIGGGYWAGSHAGASISLLDFSDSDGTQMDGTFTWAAQSGYGKYFASVFAVAGNTGPFAHAATMQCSQLNGCTAVLGVFRPVPGTVPPAAVATSSLPGVLQYHPYAATLAASGGRPPYTWAQTAGSLPDGVSLSSAGVLSGTPGTADTFSFTVQVTDDLGATATAPLSVTVTASGPVIFTGSYPADGEHAVYTNPGQISQLSMAGVSTDPFMDINVWSPVAGETVTSYVYSIPNWLVTANVDNSSLSVTCFSAVAPGNPISVDWSSLTYLISGWDETLEGTPQNPLGITASACYDNWFDSSLISPLGTAINEVMFHFDFRNRGYSTSWYAQAVPFGGSTVNGIPIPLTYWNLAASGTAMFWNQCDASGNQISTPTGAIDHLEATQWAVDNGWLSAGCTMTGFSLGFEICDTGGVNRNFWYNNLWWYGA